MTPQEFVAYQPGGYALGALAKVAVPVGSYDEDQFLNVGSDRWALQLGTPMAWYFGQSYLDPALTTIEPLPSIQFFGDNDDTQRAFELGGTVNVSFSLRASVKLSYGGVVSRNDEGPDGHMVRLIGNFAF